MRHTIFIHIGRLKTGSSALQRFFLQNRALFLERGLLIPAAGYDEEIGTHHPLAFALLGKRVGPGNIPPTAVSGEAMRAETAGHEGGILLTSEFFDARTSVALGGFLREYLPGREVVLVMYMRRQDLYVQSMFMQFCKTSRQVSPARLAQSPDLDYLGVIQAFREGVKPTAMVLRPYERGQFAGGELCRDFCHHAFGWDSIDGFKLPGLVNPRFSANALAYKIMVNQSKVPPAAKAATLDGLFEHSKHEDARFSAPYQEHALFAPAFRREILARHAAGNERIAREFLGRDDGRLFFEDPTTDSTGWTPYPGLDPAVAAEISRRILKRRMPGHSGPEINDLLNRAMVKAVLDAIGGVKPTGGMAGGGDPV